MTDEEREFRERFGKPRSYRDTPTKHLSYALGPMVRASFRRRRRELGVTLEVVGNTLYQSRQRIQQHERGRSVGTHRKPICPSLGTLYAFAVLYGCEARDFLPDVAEVMREAQAFDHFRLTPLPVVEERRRSGVLGGE
jgi:hypothetical protein